MSFLGPIFQMAAVGAMSNVGQSQDNDVFNNLLTHASDVGNVGTTPSRKGGFGLG